MKFSNLPRNIIIATVILYTLLGFFVVPLMIESQASKFVEENYKEKLQVEKISFNPYSFLLIVEKFNIPDTNSGGIDKSRLSFDRLLLNFELFPLLLKKITFKEASLEGAHIYFSFYKNKKNNWTSFVKSEPERKEKTENPWTLVLESISFSKDYFKFRDFNYATPVHLPLGPVSLRASNISTKLGSQSSLESLFINLEDNGNVLLQGKMGFTPPDIDLKIIGHKFPLDFISSYLSNSTYMEISKGFLDLNGQLTYKDAAFKLNGDAKIYDFLLRKTVDRFNVVEIKNVDFKSLFYSTTPSSFSVNDIIFSELKTSILLNPDGTLNFKGLVRPPNSEAIPVKKSEPMNYTIKSIELIDSKLDYTDLQIQPKFQAHIHDLDGKIGPLSSKSDNKIDINLTGMVEDQGKFTARGFYFQDKKPMDLNLDVKFSNVEMTTFTPYSGHFAGYEIKKGKLFLDLNYTLKNDRILGKNSVRLDNFTLGEKVKSKNSTIWPLKFALALLKDRKGQIKFSLPVEGHTNSPNFSYSSAIKTALYNMLVNIVAAPFDFLVGVFGGGKDVKLIEFENKTTQFKANNEIKIDQIAKLLEERPDVKLEILGTCAEKEFIPADAKEVPVIDEATYKECGIKRAQLVQNLLVNKKVDAERLFVMAGKKNDDSIGLPGAILMLKVD